ncbi:hypothetical protein, partial [Corynebacterium kroppenstedtii]
PPVAPAPAPNNDGGDRQDEAQSQQRRQEDTQPSETYQLQPWENFTVKQPVVENSPCGPELDRGATGQTKEGKPLHCSDSTNPKWVPW